MTTVLQPTSTQSTTSSPGDALSPTSSPPFVLSFLAIGLFSSAMIFIFWRRIRVNRAWRATIINININRSYVELPIHHDDIPKLWDIRSRENFAWGQEKEGVGVGPESNVRWVNLMVCNCSGIPSKNYLIGSHDSPYLCPPEKYWIRPPPTTEYPTSITSTPCYGRIAINRHHGII